MTSTTTQPGASTPATTIEADPALPTIRIVRDFDATPEQVCRAFTDPDLFVQWAGPRSIGAEVDVWEAETGGHYRYRALRDGAEVAAFYGSFHEVRPGERIVWTFTWEGMPDGVSLETMTFTDLGQGRTRLTGVSVVDTMEAREGMLAGGMDAGVIEGYEKLDELLARLS